MSMLQNNVKVKNVDFTKDHMTVSLSDGRSITVPLDWFPRLKNADMKTLRNWETAAAGHGIHWPELDEDIGVEGLLFGQMSTEAAGNMPTQQALNVTHTKRIF